MYIKRHLEDVINKVSKMFGATLLTGARQVGKTTLLREFLKDVQYITLDDNILLQSATDEPMTFFKDFPPPIIIDEIQYAPTLFRYIKIIIDKEREKGLFFLSGSQQFHLMKNISESLAGRVAILNILPLSLREINNISFNRPFIPTKEYFDEHKKEIKNINYDSVWNIIFNGSMPELAANQNMERKIYYSSYVKTYIERDVRDLTQVGDELKFYKFMTILASMSGKLLNLSSISRDVGISQPTANRWLSVLESSNIVYLLQPYFNNATKRAIKTPKLYFLDTGLVAYLTKWPTADTLRLGAEAGPFFETFIISEIIKSYYNAGITDLPLYFYRDKEQNEIDLLIQSGNCFHPIEIKKYSDPKKEDIKAFNILDSIPEIKRGAGGIICLYDNLLTFKDNDSIIPIDYI